MRDYINLLRNKNALQKPSVTEVRTFDWWVRRVLYFFSKFLLLFVILLVIYSFNWLDNKTGGLFNLHYRIITDYDIIDKQLIEQTIDNIKENEGKNFFTLSTSSLYAPLIKLNMVDEVHIKRVFPNTVEIKITPVTPAYRLNDDALMNKRGTKIFKAVNINKFNELPQIKSAPDYETTAVFRYNLLLEALNHIANPPRIIYFSVDKYGYSEAYLDTDTTLLFGKEDFNKRLYNFLAYCQKNSDKTLDKIKSINLFYSGGASVIFKDKEPENGLTKIEKTDI